MNSKKILLVNPPNIKIRNNYPHTGLASLASVIKSRGYDVLVLDYILFPHIPDIGWFISDFKPDVIGVSFFTATKNEADELVNEILGFDNTIPVLAGGPHVSLYYDDMKNDRQLDYLVRGEAENIIIDIVENAKKNDKPLIIEPSIPDIENVPYPDFTSFYNYTKIRRYPLLTSRGCPYHCSFCCVGMVSFHKWRARKVEQCIDEVKHILQVFPKLRMIEVMDDNPTVKLDRFKTFIKRYIDVSNRPKFAVANLRADSIDEELLYLLKRAECDHIAIGVEHGDEEIFRGINKGETQGDIRQAAKLVKKVGLKLNCCFIIGLPGDTANKNKKSIALAKELNADSFFWNMCIPYKGTRIRKWFDENGYKVDEVGRPAIYSGTNDTILLEPCVETNIFSKEERKKTFLTAMLSTSASYSLVALPKIFSYVVKYQLYREFIYFISNKWKKAVKKLQSNSWNVFYDREFGVKEFLRNLNGHSVFLDEIIKHNPERIAEIGVGTGSMSIFLSLLGYDVVGIDNDKQVLERAILLNKKMNGTAKFVYCDAFNLSKKFSTGDFNVAFSQGFFEHFKDLQIWQLLDEQLKIAKTVMFSVPSKYYGIHDFGNERLLTVDEWKLILDRYELDTLFGYGEQFSIIPVRLIGKFLHEGRHICAIMK